MRTRSWIAPALAAAALGFALVGCANNEMWGKRGDDGAKEQQVSMDQVPATVKATITKEAGGGQIQEVEKTTWRGRTAYEADVLMDGKKWELTVREDGQLLRKLLDEEDDEDDDKEDDRNEKDN